MMVSSVLLLLHGLLGVLVSTQTTDHELPEIARVGRDGVLQAELIYPPEVRPTPECHASTIVETPYGLVTAWFGGTHEKNSDVGIWVSRLCNGKWSKPTEIVNGVQSPKLRYPCWNPVLFQPKTHSTDPGEVSSPLMLFYKVGPNPREWWGMLTTSEDGGKNWSRPRKLGEDTKVGHLLGPVKNKPVQLESGPIICPSSTETEGNWKVHFEITEDLGKTWQIVGPIHDGVEFDAIQPSILIHSDGSLQILCRTQQNVLAQSWSKDDGRSWSRMTATQLPNPNAGTDAVTLRDGRQLLVYNHAVRTGSRLDGTYRTGRQILNVALSNNGLEWKTVLTLEDEDGPAEYSYPAVIQTRDGMVHTTYTWRRQSIKHVILDPVEIPW